MEYQFIVVEKAVVPNVALVRLNRPKELNALNTELMAELADACQKLDLNEAVHCMVITGNEKAFAAGADIKQMLDRNAIEMLLIDQFSVWDKIKRVKKPIVAAVSGFALGGGCELAMLCDIVVASETAQFGQPEIKIGVMPGAGGTQRLTRAIGKAKAMEMVLTGRFITAREAYQAGLITKVVPVEVYLQEAIAVAETIAKQSPLACQLAKEAVLKSFEIALDDGLSFERKNFYLLFASEDQKEGMQAFVEKRSPKWKGK